MERIMKHGSEAVSTCKQLICIINNATGTMFYETVPSAIFIKLKIDSNLAKF